MNAIFSVVFGRLCIIVKCVKLLVFIASLLNVLNLLVFIVFASIMKWWLDMRNFSLWKHPTLHLLW